MTVWGNQAPLLPSDNYIRQYDNFSEAIWHGIYSSEGVDHHYSSGKGQRKPAPHCIWWTSEYTDSIKDRSRAFAIFKATPNLDTLAVYSDQCKRTKNILKRTKRNSFRDKASSFDPFNSTSFNNKFFRWYKNRFYTPLAKYKESYLTTDNILISLRPLETSHPFMNILLNLLQLLQLQLLHLVCKLRSFLDLSLQLKFPMPLTKPNLTYLLVWMISHTPNSVIYHIIIFYG